MLVNIKRKRKVGYRGIKWWGRHELDYPVFKEAINYERRVKADGGTVEKLYCVHMSLALLSLPDPCEATGGQLLYNFSFDCDGGGWTNFNATSTYSNGTASVIRTGPGGTIRQEVYLEAGIEYDIKVKVDSVTSSAYVSWIEPGGNSGFPLDYIGVGIHKTTIQPTITGTHILGIGTNSPNGSNGVFDYMILRMK